MPTPHSEPTAPIAPIKPHRLSIHGDDRIDNYWWMRNPEDRDIAKYLEQENAYTKQQFSQHSHLVNEIERRLEEKSEESTQQAPVRNGQTELYFRSHSTKSHPSFFRKIGDQPEELLLDLNDIVAGESFCQVGAMTVSPNGTKLAFSIDLTGSESYTLFVKDLTTQTISSDRIVDTVPFIPWERFHFASASVAWADDETLYYVAIDTEHQGRKVMRHRIGTPMSVDDLVYKEEDHKFFAKVRRTRSGAYIFVELVSRQTRETLYLLTSDPKAEPKRIEERKQGHKYLVDHHSDRFYILTNDGAPNFRLIETSILHPKIHEGREIVPEHPHTILDDISVFRDHLVLYEERDGLTQICIKSLRSFEQHYLSFAEEVYAVEPCTNLDFESSIVRICFSSPITPNVAYDHNMATGERTRVWSKSVSEFDPKQYRSTRIYATANDGTRIPISLVYKRIHPNPGPRPTVVYGYGAYGDTTEPEFSSHRLVLLDRGFIYAIAHVRGGSENGTQWYNKGKHLSKWNSFTDFIACIDHLVAAKYTTHKQVTLKGESAGGMLVATVINVRPDIAGAVVLLSPFLDVASSLLDPTQQLTESEYEEWGDPRDSRTYEYIRTYSPYDNIRNYHYPHILVTSGRNDTRVPFWEQAKYIAKMRVHQKSDQTILLHTEMNAGHFGGTGSDHARDLSILLYTFMILATESVVVV